jgi:hypothetical protein
MQSNGRQSQRVVQINRRCFPDSGSWLEQEVIVSEAFNVMASEIREAVKRG